MKKRDVLVAAASGAGRVAQLEAFLARHADGQATERDRDSRKRSNHRADHRLLSSCTGTNAKPIPDRAAAATIRLHIHFSNFRTPRSHRWLDSYRPETTTLDQPRSSCAVERGGASRRAGLECSEWPAPSSDDVPRSRGSRSSS